MEHALLSTIFFPHTFFLGGFSSINRCWNSSLATCSQLFAASIFQIPKMTGRDFRCEISEIPPRFGSRPQGLTGRKVSPFSARPSSPLFSGSLREQLEHFLFQRPDDGLAVVIFILEIISVLEVFFSCHQKLQFGFIDNGKTDLIQFYLSQIF